MDENRLGVKLPICATFMQASHSSLPPECFVGQTKKPLTRDPGEPDSRINGQEREVFG
jgi:hypothetical protein